MLISIVVATKNRKNLIENCLKALESQSVEKSLFEVLVVNDGSTDGTDSFLEMYQKSTPLNFKVITNGISEGPAKARNKGIREARGEYIGFTDDDCVPSFNWIENAVKFFKDHPVILGIEGRITTDKYGPFFHSVINDKSKNGSIYNGYLTANMFYKREALMRLNGFNEAFPLPFREDSDLAFRVLKLGEIKYSHDVCVFHPAVPLSLKAAIKREGRHRVDALFYNLWPKEYVHMMGKSNIIWILFILSQLLSVVYFLLLFLFPNTYRNEIGFPILSNGMVRLGWLLYLGILGTLGFFVAGKGIKGGLYRMLGSYYRFYSFSIGGIKYKKRFPWPLILLKSLFV